MAEMKLEVRTEADMKCIYLELQADTVPLGHMFLNSFSLDDLIRKLAHHRAQLLDEVPLEVAGNVELEVVVDPMWRTLQLVALDENEQKVDDHAALILRHPGYGWLSFALPAHEARRLGEWLLLHSGQSNEPRS